MPKDDLYDLSMTNEQKLKILMRERVIAMRKIKARSIQWMLFKIRLREMMFWRTPDFQSSPEVNQYVRKLAPEMLDQKFPPPRDGFEHELSKKNRSLRCIDADIALIPPVTVTKTEYAPDSLPTFGGKTMVRCKLGRRSYGFRYNEETGIDARTVDQWVLETRYSLQPDETLNQALCITSAHEATTVTVFGPAFPKIPTRSTVRLEERQNTFQPGDCPCDGRHFIQILALSEQLKRALIDHIALLDDVQGKFERRHVLCVALDHDDTPREIPLYDPAPLIEHAPQRLRELLVVEMTSEKEDAGIVNAVLLTESE